MERDKLMSNLHKSHKNATHEAQLRVSGGEHSKQSATAAQEQYN